MFESAAVEMGGIEHLERALSEGRALKRRNSNNIDMIYLPKSKIGKKGSFKTEKGG